MAGIELATAYISIIPETSKVAPGVKKALGGVEGEAGRAGTRSGKAYGDSMTKSVGASAKKMAAGIGLAFAAVKVGSFLKDSIAEGREAQKVGALTASTIKATGGAANVSAKQIGDFASALSAKVGIDDEAIQSGQNMLLTFKNVRNEAGKGNDVFNQATTALIDMSSAMGTEPKQAAIQLGKALNDPVKGVAALGRVGVQFTAQQKTQIKTMVAAGDTMGAQKLILGELTSQFGGAAAAQATAGDKMKVAFDNLKESIGTGLIPVLDKAMTFLTTDAIPAVVGTSKAIGALPGPVKAAAAAWLLYAAAQKAGITGSVASGFAGLAGAMTGMRIRTMLARDAFVAARTGATNMAAPMGRAASAMSGLGAAAAGAGGAMRRGLGGVSSMLGGPWGMAIIAAAALGMAFWAKQKKQAAAVKEMTAALDKQTGALTANNKELIGAALRDSGAIDAAEQLGINLNLVQLAAEGNVPKVKELSEELRRLKADAVAVQDAAGRAGPSQSKTITLIDKVTDSYTGQNKVIRESQADLHQQGLQMDTNTGKLSKIKTQADLTAEANKKLADKFKADAAEAKKAAEALQLFLDKLEKQRAAALQASGGMIAYEASLDAARESLKENGRTLDITTEAGRANQSALDSTAGAWNDLNNRQQNAKGAFKTARDALIEQAVAFGDTREEAKRYADRVLEIPTKISTKVHIDDVEAKAKLKALRQAARDRRMVIRAYFEVHGRVPGTVGDTGGITARAGGGPVRAGRPYVVGEHRRELFIPDRSGRIEASVPAAKSGGNTYNTTVVADDPWGWKRSMDHMTRAEAMGAADFR